MKTILITGGTSGIGAGLAQHYLANGDQVIIVSRSKGALPNAIYLQADLSLAAENYRIAELISTTYGKIDGLILCAVDQAYRQKPLMTTEGLEVTFALQYLSRYILSHQIILNSTGFMLNIATPGMNGAVNFDDLQRLKKFSSLRANINGNRLNDLLGAAFVNTGIKYILYNPMSVRTAGARSVFANPLMRLFLKFWHRVNGRDVATVVQNIGTVLRRTSANQFIAYKTLSPVKLSRNTFDPDKAKKLERATERLLATISA
ncbi:SDR family NAD(P)-dependent oxidoreductase [Loigolactobacillus binensis]|uniref:SDR family NAD(P)-dependent oxidoreductase n=1 Tax=Loigolactobacillus binensis TaxID=2559922 RepID=A0ABW3ECG8_9LACO|nr:SDR family NAD(P)-dependent oxidoreductase [Loigolactobacillus binensis]